MTGWGTRDGEPVAGALGLRLLLWLALGTWFLWPVLGRPYAFPDTHDGAYFLQYAIAAHRTIVQFHEFPSWSPYYCGGISAISNLQVNAGAPPFWLTVPFGLMPGLRLALLLYFALGMEGAWRYARHVGATGAGALAAGVFFGLSGRFAHLIHDGQVVFVGLQLAPWVLVGLDKGIRSPRWAVVGGVAMAGIFLEGGAVGTPLLVLAVAFATLYHTLLTVAVDRDVPWYHPLGAAGMLGFVALGVAGFRALPAIADVLAYPRTWQGDEAYKLPHLLSMLFTAVHDSGYADPGTAYVGWSAAVAFGYALLRLDKGAWRLVPLCVIFTDLAMGYEPGLGLYELIKKLPILQNIRAPFRFTFLLALLVAVGAGRGLTLLQQDLLRLAGSQVTQRVAGWLRAPWRRLGPGLALVSYLVAGLVAVTAAAGVARHNRVRVEKVSMRDVPWFHDRDFRQSIGNRWHAEIWPAAGLGSLRCFEEQPFFTSAALRGDRTQEEFLADPTAGTVRRAAWSPHRITLDIDLRRPATVVVNQNEHRGWRVDRGEIVSHEGLLAVRAPAGRYRLAIRHADPLLRLGAGLTLATLAILAVAWRWSRRRS